MAGTNANSINYFSPAKWVVSTVAGEGTHTTIAGALAAASALDQIVVMPGTYTEDNTISAGVAICAFNGGQGSKVIVQGKFTITAAINVLFNNITMETNSDYALVVSGSAASLVTLNNCYLDCANHTGISYTTSSGSANIFLYNCLGDLGTTGIGYHTSSSAGALTYNYCYFTNSGSSTTASSNSAGSVVSNYSTFGGCFSSSSTGGITTIYTNFNLSGLNTTAVTANGTGTHNLFYAQLYSGSASALSIGSGAAVTGTFATISSTNTDSITGSGSYTSNGTIFTGSSHLSNVTTQTGGAASGLTQGTAPSAGFIGEQISSAATTTSLSNGAAKTITSINLTPGIWDISALAAVNGSSNVVTDWQAGISTAANTVQGNLGDLYGRYAGVASVVLSVTVPVVRATLSGAATYYLCGTAAFGSGTANGQGRITATRVG